MTTHTMESILDSLNEARQRATYGAVSAVVGSSPRTLMAGRDRDPRHSWIVSRKNGMPTGYTEELIHPELLTSERVIDSREELLNWLSTREATLCAA